MADPVSIVIEPATLQVQAGAPVDAHVTIRNGLDRVGQFQLFAECPDPSWARWETDQLGVFPQDESGTILHLQPSAGTIPAMYSLALFAITLTGERVQVQASLDLTVYAEGSSASALAVLPSLQVKLSLEPALVQVVAGEGATAQIRVFNNTDRVGQFRLQVHAPAATWAEFEPDQVGVFPDDEATAQIHFHPPQDTAPATYPIIVRAISQTGEAIQSQTTLGLEVHTPRAAAAESSGAPVPAEEQIFVRASSPSSGLELLADTQDVALFAGTEHRLRLQNSSGLAVSLELLLRGLPGSWYTLAPSLLILDSTRSMDVNLRLSPIIEAPPGDYPFSLIAETRGERASSMRVDLMLEISQPGEFKVQVTPPWLESESQGEFDIHLSQGGATPMKLKLSGSDEANACEYIFPPGPVVLSPFDTLTRRLIVVPRQRVEGAGSRMHLFTITATAIEGGHTTHKARARFIQRATEPPQLTLTAIQTKSAWPTFVVNIGNPSTVDSDFQLSADDPGNVCRYEFANASVRVPAGGQAQTFVRAIPQRQQRRLGDRIITFQVHVVPSSNLLEPATAAGQFVQKHQDPTAIALLPSSQAAPKSARYTIQLTNPRPTPVDVVLQPNDTQGQFIFELAPTQFHLAPQSRATARLNARLTTKLLPGEARHIHPFSIAMRVADLDEPIVSEGSFVQVVGSPFTPPVIALLVIIVVGLILILFFAFQLLVQLLAGLGFF